MVDIFEEEGTLARRFATNGPLNAPWGIAEASANFGPFANHILIGNFGAGFVNAFDPVTGEFLGPLRDPAGKAIVNPGLWALVFRADGLGDPNTVHFTASGSRENHGLRGMISPSN